MRVFTSEIAMVMQNRLRIPFMPPEVLALWDPDLGEQEQHSMPKCPGGPQMHPSGAVGAPSAGRTD